MVQHQASAAAHIRAAADGSGILVKTVGRRPGGKILDAHDGAAVDGAAGTAPGDTAPGLPVVKRGGVSGHGDGRISLNGAAGASRIHISLDGAPCNAYRASLPDGASLACAVNGAGDDSARDGGVGTAGNGACQASPHHVSVNGASVDVNVRGSPDAGRAVVGIRVNAAHDLAGKRAGVNHDVHVPLDIRSIGSDHGGGAIAGEGAEGGVFRGEFQINVSGHAGGVHGAEDGASARGGVRKAQGGIPVQRSGISMGPVPGGGLPFLGDGQPDVPRIIAGAGIHMRGVSGSDGDVHGVSQPPGGGVRLGAGIEDAGAILVGGGMREASFRPRDVALRSA